jgi:phospholipase C
LNRPHHDGSTAPLSRRRFLQLGAAGLAGAALGAGCSTDRKAADADLDGVPDADEVPTTALSDAKQGRLSDVQHVIVILQAGASFDQVFGARRGVRGFDDPDASTLATGQPIWYQPDPSSPDGHTLPFPLATAGPGPTCVPGLEQSWTAQHAARADGRMDGFAQHMGALSLGYYRPEDLPWYHALADEFTLCTSWFSPVLGPASPNRVMAMSGTIDPTNKAGGPVIDDRSGRFGWETYPERLERAGVGWKLYADGASRSANGLSRFVQFDEVRPPHGLWEAGVRDRTIGDFEADCAANQLPWVSWVAVPPPPASAGGLGWVGQQAFVARAVAAVMGNPELWKGSMIVLAHDSSGGAFDHVAPPTPPPDALSEFVGDDPIGLGPRVPALVLSPWSRGGIVHDTVVDHTSVLRFLELRFGVEAPLISPWRRERTGNLLDALDLASFDPTVPDLPAPTPPPSGGTCFAGAWPGAPSPQAPPPTST